MKKDEKNFQSIINIKNNQRGYDKKKNIWNNKKYLKIQNL